MAARGAGGEMAGDRPPLLCPIVFFSFAGMDHGGLLFRTPENSGGLAPLRADGYLDLNWKRASSATPPAQIFPVVPVRAADHADLSCAAIRSRLIASDRSIAICCCGSSFRSEQFLIASTLDDHPGPNAALARSPTRCSVSSDRNWCRCLQSFAVLVCPSTHLPFMVLPRYANLKTRPGCWTWQDLGADAWQRFWRITFLLSVRRAWALHSVHSFSRGIFAIPASCGPNDS
jgi:spermidine/putrescine transport system permease protein